MSPAAKRTYDFAYTSSAIVVRPPTVSSQPKTRRELRQVFDEACMLDLGDGSIIHRHEAHAHISHQDI